MFIGFSLSFFYTGCKRNPCVNKTIEYTKWHIIQPRIFQNSKDQTKINLATVVNFSKLSKKIYLTSEGKEI